MRPHPRVEPMKESTPTTTPETRQSPQKSGDTEGPWENPMGTFGFEFVEFTAEDTEALGRLFETMGFHAVARHRSKAVTHYQQNDINFIVNAEPRGFAQSFARVHGPSVCAIGFRVRDAAKAYARAVDLGAEPQHGQIGPMELNIPAIRGVGGSLIYLVDRGSCVGFLWLRRRAGLF